MKSHTEYTECGKEKLCCMGKSGKLTIPNLDGPCQATDYKP